MSKSELRRLEIVAPEAIKQLREQIAQKFEAVHAEKCDTPLHRMQLMHDGSPFPFACTHIEDAAIARGEK